MALLDIGDEIAKVLNEYSDEVVKATNEAVDETAKEAVEELKTAGDFKDRSGKYRKGWSKVKGDNHFGVQSQVIKNKEYRLTHLLEKGHAKRNGGRVRAYPHIAPVEEGLSDKIQKKIEEKLS